MCLKKITAQDEQVPEDLREGVGYKVFRVERDATTSRYFLGFQWRELAKRAEVPMGHWVKAESRHVWTDGHNKADPIEAYMSGFHIYLDKADAQFWSSNRWYRVVEVKYRGGRVLGDDGGRVIVADEMLVPYTDIKMQDGLPELVRLQESTTEVSNK